MSSPKAPIAQHRSSFATLVSGAIGVLAAALLTAAFRKWWAGLQPPLIFAKDYLQDYLAGRAILQGADPYAPLPELLRRYEPAGMGTNIFRHPTPHTPLQLFALLPLALLPFRDAAAAMWGIDLVCLCGAAYLLARRTAGLSRLQCGWTVLILLSSYPVFLNLMLGQINGILLALAAAVLIFGRDPRPTGLSEAAAGAALGCLLGLKLWGWPMMLYLLARRRIKTVVMAMVSLLILFATAATALGGEPLRRYLSEVLPRAGEEYLAHNRNQSLLALPHRLCAGTVSPDSDRARSEPGLRCEPYVKSAALGALVFISAVAVGLAVWGRRPALDGATVVLLSAVANPIAWEHYMVLALPLFLALYRVLGGVRPLFVALGVLLWSAGLMSGLVHPDAGPSLLPPVEEPLPFAQGLVDVVPLLAALVLIGYAIAESRRLPGSLR